MEKKDEKGMEAMVISRPFPYRKLMGIQAWTDRYPIGKSWKKNSNLGHLPSMSLTESNHNPWTKIHLETKSGLTNWNPFSIDIWRVTF